MFELFLTIGLAAALVAGIFLAFSSFVMPALDNIAPKAAIVAMQRINIDVFSWSFGVLFFGIPIACIGVGGYAFTQLTAPWAVHALAGVGIYLIGSLLVTIVGNVPLNDKLARVKPEAPCAHNDWRTFTVPWVRWNHLRTLASAAAALAFILAAVHAH